MSVSNENLLIWSNKLQEMYPHLPTAVIDETLRRYADHTATFNDVCEEHKVTPFEPKERDVKSIYDTTESGNDLSWGVSPAQDLEEENRE